MPFSPSPSSPRGVADSGIVAHCAKITHCCPSPSSSFFFFQSKLWWSSSQKRESRLHAPSPFVLPSPPRPSLSPSIFRLLSPSALSIFRPLFRSFFVGTEPTSDRSFLLFLPISSSKQCDRPPPPPSFFPHRVNGVSQSPSSPFFPP